MSGQWKINISAAVMAVVLLGGVAQANEQKPFVTINQEHLVRMLQGRTVKIKDTEYKNFWTKFGGGGWFGKSDAPKKFENDYGIYLDKETKTPRLMLVKGVKNPVTDPRVSQVTLHLDDSQSFQVVVDSDRMGDYRSDRSTRRTGSGSDGSWSYNPGSSGSMSIPAQVNFPFIYTDANGRQQNLPLMIRIPANFSGSDADKAALRQNIIDALTKAGFEVRPDGSIWKDGKPTGMNVDGVLGNVLSNIGFVPANNGGNGSNGSVILAPGSFGNGNSGNKYIDAMSGYGNTGGGNVILAPGAGSTGSGSLDPRLADLQKLLLQNPNLRDQLLAQLLSQNPNLLNDINSGRFNVSPYLVNNGGNNNAALAQLLGLLGNPSTGLATLNPNDIMARLRAAGVNADDATLRNLANLIIAAGGDASKLPALLDALKRAGVSDPAALLLGLVGANPSRSGSTPSIGVFGPGAAVGGFTPYEISTATGPKLKIRDANGNPLYLNIVGDIAYGPDGKPLYKKVNGQWVAIVDPASIINALNYSGYEFSGSLWKRTSGSEATFVKNFGPVPASAMTGDQVQVFINDELSKK